jgi:hypothetical protein
LEGEESLQKHLRIVFSTDGSKSIHLDVRELWLETEAILRDQKKLIDSLDIDQAEKDTLQLLMAPASIDNIPGVPLDKSVSEMLVSKQKGFREDQSTERRNELKNRIARLGQICLVARNNLQQPHGKYSALENRFCRMFSKTKYSVADMMAQLTDQEEVTEVRELLAVIFHIICM